MAYQEDFLCGEDFDAILEAIENDILIEDEQLHAEVTQVVNEIEEEPSVSGFKCEKCELVCKSKQGLSRHRNAKHRSEGEDIKKEVTAEDRLHPLYFKQYVNKCAKEIFSEGCYSEKTLKCFETYNCSLDEANMAYKYIKDVIKKYDGDAEKFYPKFYDCVSGDDIVFKDLNRNCSIILGFEVANSVLAHLNGTLTPEQENKQTCIEFSSKERNIVKYLAGYVINTLYRRLRKSPKHNSDTNIQHLSLLYASKDLSENSKEDDTLIDAKNRGGLYT